MFLSGERDRGVDGSHGKVIFPEMRGGKEGAAAR